MGARSALIIKGALVLAALWAGIWGIMSIAGVFEVTPEKIEAYIDARPFPEVTDAAERKERIEKIAGMINRLNYDQRQEFRRGVEGNDGTSRGGGDRFFDELNSEERLYFVDLTMGTAFKKMMEAFNEMEPEERKSYVERARRDLEQGEGDRRRAERLESEDKEVYDKIAEEGLRSYFQDASAETKMDLAPLMEEMQRLMRRPGR